MLSFQPVTIEDKERLTPYLSHENYHMCEQSFVDLFIWKDAYDTHWCIQDDLLFLAQFSAWQPGQLVYFPPMGPGDVAKGMADIRQDAAQRGMPLLIGAVPEPVMERWQRQFPGEFDYQELRSAADYVYLSEKLISLSGKKLHGKRNFINRFLAEHQGNWSFTPMNSGCMENVLRYHRHWSRLNQTQDDPSFQKETHAIELALHHFDQLGLQGGVLKVGEDIVAFTLGAQATEDTFVVQIEKADHTITGAYPMINQQFAAYACSQVTYINREDDLGLEGLRRAKLSYDPVFLTKKYLVKPV